MGTAIMSSFPLVENQEYNEVEDMRLIVMV